MMLDELLEFADATALGTGGTGRALVGDVIDLGAPPTGSVYRDIGSADPLFLVISVDTAVGFGAAGTVSFILASDAQAAIATDGSASEHAVSQTFSAAKPLAAGAAALVVQLPREGVAYERYLGILQNVGANALASGKINAFLTRDVAVWKAYTDGV